MCVCVCLHVRMSWPWASVSKADTSGLSFCPMSVCAGLAQCPLPGRSKQQAGCEQPTLAALYVSCPIG